MHSGHTLYRNLRVYRRLDQQKYPLVSLGGRRAVKAFAASTSLGGAMDFPLDDDGRGDVEAFKLRVTARVPEPEMLELLCDLRTMIWLAKIEHRPLAEKIKQLAQPALQNGAIPGHNRQGEFNARAMSAELDYRERRLPRDVVWKAVVELYSRKLTTPTTDELKDHLSGLHRRALQAKHRHQQQIIQRDAGDRRDVGSTGDDASVEAATDNSPESAEVAALRERVRQLEDDHERDVNELERLTARVGELDEKLNTAREQLEAQADASEQRAEESWRKHVAAQARLDQLDGEVADLRRRLERRSWLQRLRRAGDHEKPEPSGSGPDAEQQHDDSSHHCGGSETPKPPSPEAAAPEPTGTHRTGPEGDSTSIGGRAPERSEAGRPGGAAVAVATPPAPTPPRSKFVAGSVLAMLLIALLPAIPFLPARAGTVLPSFAACLVRYNGNTQVFPNTSLRSLYQAASASDSENYDIVRDGRLNGTIAFYSSRDVAEEAIRTNSVDSRLSSPSAAILVRNTAVTRLAVNLPASSSLFTSANVCK